MKADELKTVIVMLKTLKTLSAKSGKNTAVLSVNIDSFNFVIDEAIKALEQQIKQEVYMATGMLPIEELKHLEEQTKKARLQLISAEQEPCEDCISRQAVLEAFWKLDIEIRPSAIDVITDMIKLMPPATPQPKMESEEEE